MKRPEEPSFEQLRVNEVTGQETSSFHIDQMLRVEPNAHPEPRSEEI